MRETSDQVAIAVTARPTCGLVMPISEIDGLSESHWSDVRRILTDALGQAGYSARIVSSSEAVAIIQKSIVQNLYFDELVICDVSAKNPNVMFELGMRLAFDKPTIVIKDDRTSFSFDTSPFEHLTYPRDLRYNLIADFKTLLIEKVAATMRVAKADGYQGSFLKAFGNFTVAKIETKEVGEQQYIIEQLDSISDKLNLLSSRALEGEGSTSRHRVVNPIWRFRTRNMSDVDIQQMIDEILKLGDVDTAFFNMDEQGTASIAIKPSKGASTSMEFIKELIEAYDKKALHAQFPDR